MDDDEYSNDDDDLARQMRVERMRQMRMGDEDMAAAEDDENMADVLDYEDVKGQLSLWV
jgi:hypothetical protein